MTVAQVVDPSGAVYCRKTQSLSLKGTSMAFRWLVFSSMRNWPGSICRAHGRLLAAASLRFCQDDPTNAADNKAASPTLDCGQGEIGKTRLRILPHGPMPMHVGIDPVLLLLLLIRGVGRGVPCHRGDAVRPCG